MTNSFKAPGTDTGRRISRHWIRLLALSALATASLAGYTVDRSFEAERAAVIDDQSVIEGFRGIGELLQLWPGYEVAGLERSRGENAELAHRRLLSAWTRWREREQEVRPILLTLSESLKAPRMVADLDEARAYADRLQAQARSLLDAHPIGRSPDPRATALYEHDLLEGLRELREVRAGLLEVAHARADRREADLDHREKVVVGIEMAMLLLLLFTAWSWTRTERHMRVLEQERNHARAATIRSEQRLAATAEQLREANHELELFCSAVAHDLKAPLRQIRGYTALLIGDLEDRLMPREREHLRFIEASGAKAMGQIDDLYTLAHVSGRPMTRMPVDLSHLSGSILRELRERAPDRDAEVRVEPGMSVHADPGLTQLLIANLLENAWKFTAKQPVARIEVFRDVGSGEGAPMFVVRDNGAGFHPDGGARLFTPFTRLHGAGEYPGTGLGLAMVARIVRRHAGSITAEGRPGAGATFRFSLGG